MPHGTDEERDPRRVEPPPEGRTGADDADTDRLPAAPEKGPLRRKLKTSINTDIYKDPNRPLPA
jgi:hypothetical protein